MSSPATFDGSHLLIFIGDDSTKAFDNASDAAKRSGKCLVVPSGSFIYNGNGFDGWDSPCILGEGQTSSTVYLGGGKYLVDVTNGWHSLLVQNVGFRGGAGAIRSRKRTFNDEQEYVVEHCLFRDFSSVAISANEADMPYWIVRDNNFYGLNTRQSIDIALAGNNDASLIESNSFGNQRIAVKLGRGGSNVHIAHNDFVQGSRVDPRSPFRRAAIWIVPSEQPTVSGLTIEANKFGNENLDVGDIRLLFADDKPQQGKYFGDTLWDEGPSKGFIVGLSMGDNNYVAGGVAEAGESDVNPICLSYTPNVRNSRFAAVIAGTYPRFVLQFGSTLAQEGDAYNGANIFGPFLGYDVHSGNRIMEVSNWAGLGYLIDPTGEAGRTSNGSALEFTPDAGHADFLDLIPEGTPALERGRGDAGEKAPAKDAYGGRDALAYKFNAAGHGELDHVLRTNVNPGDTIWIEGDIRREDSSPPSSSIAVLLRGPESQLLMNKALFITKHWRHFRLAYTSQIAVTNPVLIFTNNPSTIGGTSFDIGSVKVYRSAAPSVAGQRTGPVANSPARSCETDPPKVCWTAGAKSPSGACSNGSLYSRIDNGSLYVCEAHTWQMK